MNTDTKTRTANNAAREIVKLVEAEVGTPLSLELSMVIVQAVYRAMEPMGAFQSRVRPWLLQCFGTMIAGDREERNHRFLEEALELVQSLGCSQSEAHQLVDYVYGRPVGEPSQEAGGVMVTLAALCLANGMDMNEAGEVELVRIWTKVKEIRAKQAAKPKHGPLPTIEEVSGSIDYGGPVDYTRLSEY